MKRTIIKLEASVLLVFALMVGMTSCHHKDPDYDDVKPPVIAVVAPTLSGVVTTNGGAPVSGATIVLSGAGNFTATTDANGAYTLKDLNVGTYNVKAEAAGKTSHEGSLTVAAGEIDTWNALLPVEVRKELIVNKDELAKMFVPVPEIATNSAHATEVEVDIAAGTFDRNVTIGLTFKNSTTPAAKASKSVSLLTMSFDASDPTVKFLKPVIVNVPVNPAPKSVTLNGAALTTNYANGNLGISLTGLGVISLNYDVTTSETSKSESLTFTPAQWDNLYGSVSINATSAKFPMNVGGTVTGSNAMLNNALALDMSVAGVKTITEEYPLNVSVPVGTAVLVTGKQSVKTITYTIAAGTGTGTGSDTGTATATVTATAQVYGDATITTQSYNRQHTGGSN